MGSVRLIASICYCFLAFGVRGPCDAQIQLSNENQKSSNYRAYFQPLTRSEYQRPDKSNVIPRSPGQPAGSAALPFPHSIAPYADPPFPESNLEDSASSQDVPSNPQTGDQAPPDGFIQDTPDTAPAIHQGDAKSSGGDRPPANHVRFTDAPLMQPFGEPQVSATPEYSHRVRSEDKAIVATAEPNPVFAVPGFKTPRIVQPGLLGPNEPTARQGIRTSPSSRAVYQPLYQPIPGIASTGTTDPPGALYSEMESAPSPAPPTIRPTEPATQMEAYSSGPIRCTCPSSACQSCCSNFYFSFQGGWAGLRDLESRSGLGQLITEDGTGFSLGLGCRTGCELRTEINFSFHQNDITGFENGSSIEALSGELTSFAGMANAYWDLTNMPSRCFQPYVGLGVGFVSIDSEIRDRVGSNLIPLGLDNDTSLAYQWMGGINFQACRNLDLFAEYRYLRADNYHLETTRSMSDRYRFETDNVFFGLRWKY